MDWKLLLSTFAAVLLAELGDKTQLATVALATRGSRWSVFLGASLALIVSSALGVLAAEVLTRWISPVLLRRSAAVLFVVLGALMWWSARD